MFHQPSQHDVRRFFCETHQRVRANLPLESMQAVAAPWIDAHPEYHNELSDVEAAVAKSYSVEDGRTNPFLHLSMHVTISEQYAVDQPRGVKQALDLLAARLGSMHDAHHVAMEALGEMIWQSQRSGLPPDGQAYMDSLRRRATASAR